MYKLLFFLCTLTSFIVQIHVVNATTYDRDYISTLVQEKVRLQFPPPDKGRTFIDVSEVDPRITIKPCQSTLHVQIPKKSNNRHLNVKLTCEDDLSWHLFIPVKITYQLPIVVANTSLKKGSRLSEQDIKVIYRNSATIRPNAIANPEQVLGARIKRFVFKGKILTYNNICWVCKGETVTIIARTAGLEIKSLGTAISNGNLGDSVTVKNDKSGRIIKGQVNAINQVIINL